MAYELGSPERPAYNPEFDALVSDTAFAKVSLDNLILRGDYIATNVRDANPPIKAVIDYNDSEVISSILTCPDPKESTGMFYNRIEASMPGIKGSLQRGNYPLDKADQMIRQASARIVNDIEEGGLRFFTFDRPNRFDVILTNTLRDEYKRPLPDPKTVLPLELEPEPKILTLDEVLPQLPNLRGQLRKALVMRGLMGLSPKLIGQLLGIKTNGGHQLLTSYDGRMRGMFNIPDNQSEQLNQ